MFLFTLILVAFSRKLDFFELESLNSTLSNFLDGNLKEKEFDSAISKFIKKETSDKYVLLIDGVQQKKDSELNKVAEDNSDRKFFAMYSSKLVLNLTYILPKNKCIKGIKLQTPQNVSKENVCNWISGFDNYIEISEDTYSFTNEWETDECIDAQSFSIISQFPQLSLLKDIICFGDLEIIY